MVLAAIEDVDQERDRVATARECRSGDHVESDPEAQRIAIGKRSRSSQADGEPPEDHQDPDDAERQEYFVAARDEFAPYRDRVAAHCVSSSLFRRRLRNITAPSRP